MRGDVCIPGKASGTEVRDAVRYSEKTVRPRDTVSGMVPRPE